MRILHQRRHHSSHVELMGAAAEPSSAIPAMLQKVTEGALECVTGHLVRLSGHVTLDTLYQAHLERRRGVESGTDVVGRW